jgi:hypothetical protein
VFPAHTCHRVASVALDECDAAGGAVHNAVISVDLILHTGAVVVMAHSRALKAVVAFAAYGLQLGSISQISQVQVHAAHSVGDTFKDVNKDIPGVFIGGYIKLGKVFSNNKLIELFHYFISDTISFQVDVECVGMQVSTCEIRCTISNFLGDNFN